MLSLIIILILLARCIDYNTPAPPITNSAGEQFAGTEACKSCHKSVYTTYTHTAHNTTSQPGKKEHITGSFDAGKNIVYYTPYDYVIMEERDSGLYQASYYKGATKQEAPIDVVIGSGTNGQSYLYWKNNALFQLPVSYFTASGSWANSPGNGAAIKYNRLVYAHCLECHATYAKQTDNNNSQFDKNKLVYSVSCESCHGAAAKHVQYQQQHPGAKDAKFIINPGTLSQLQQVDQCGLCHSGIRQNIKPVFSFMPGDTLANFYTENKDTLLNSDVHGNKYGLLQRSACYKNSGTLTCTTCHNSHETQKGNLNQYAAACRSCHTPANHNFCKLAPVAGTIINTHCIDCHMPLRGSQVLSVYLPQQDKTIAATLRQHLIKVYPEETAKVLDYLQQQQ